MCKPLEYAGTNKPIYAIDVIRLKQEMFKNNEEGDKNDQESKRD